MQRFANSFLSQSRLVGRSLRNDQVRVTVLICSRALHIGTLVLTRVYMALLTLSLLQSLFLTQQSQFHTSTSFARELTEGTSSTEPHTSGFQKLRQNFANFITGGKHSGDDPKGDGDVDR